MPAPTLPRATAAALGLAAVSSAITLAPGLNPAASLPDRAKWIAGHASLWTVGWGTVLLPMVMLGAFFVWWALRLPRGRWTPILIAVAGAAVLLDVAGITLFMTFDSTRGETGTYRQAELLTAGWATALYSLVGSLLTRQTPELPRRARALLWWCWLGGVGLWLSTLARYTPGTFLSVTVNWTLLPFACLIVGSQNRFLRPSAMGITRMLGALTCEHLFVYHPATPHGQCSLVRIPT